jgi:pyrophosphatase PpaX
VEAHESAFDTFLFDLDGTLLDSIELIFRCYRHAANTHMGELPPDSVWRDGLGTPLRQQFAAVTSDAALIEEMVATYREYHHEHHDTSVQLYPGIARAVDVLAQRGANLGIVTSKLRAGAERGLKLTGLMDHFPVLVTADEVTRPKPDPEPVLAALERTGARPESTIFIGDSPHDMNAGRGAGVATAAVLWGPFGADDLSASSPSFLLENPEEILAL